MVKTRVLGHDGLQLMLFGSEDEPSMASYIVALDFSADRIG